MYAIKIENGKERIRVRHYNNGFLPSYTSCAEESMGKRLFVVPGYIFLMTKVSGAEKVPDSEWKVIEAISDSHPSTLDVEKKQIIDGPLKDLLILHINPSLKSVCIRAKLLGVTRDYWLGVRFASPPSPTTEEKNEKNGDEKSDDEKAADVVELKESKGEGKRMAKTTYTDEQINEAVELAKKIGIHAAGKELSIPWQSVQGFCKKAGVMDKVSKKPAKKTKKAAATAVSPTVEEKAEMKAEEKAEKKAEKPAKPAKRTRKAKAEAAATPATPVEKEKATKNPTQPASALEIENAVLKAENEQLKAKIEKLQKALAELI